MKKTKKHSLFLLLTTFIYVLSLPVFSQQKDYKKSIENIESTNLSHDTKNALEKIDSILVTDYNTISAKNKILFETLKVEALTRGLFFEESLILSKELLQNENITIYQKIKTLINNALAYEYVGKFKECEKKLKAIKKIYQDKNVQKNDLYGRYLYRTSSFYRIQGIKKEALEYAQKAYDFGFENNHEEVTAVASMCIGLLKSNNEAITYINKTLKFYKKIDNLYGMAGNYLTLAGKNQNLKRYNISLKYYDSVIYTLQNKYHFEMIATSYRKKSDIYEKLNRLDSAINNLKKYTQFYKKDRLEKQKIKVNQLTFNHNIEKIDFLNNKNKIQQNTNYHQKIALFLMTIGFVVIVLFLRKTIKDKKVITNQKVQTEKALNEKKVLLKEVHHRIKNNLQVINSILDIQNAKIEDKRFNKILEEGQNRIQSIALIHQQLYQSDSIVDISMEKYIKDLVKNISTFNRDKKIDFNISANQIKFKINTSVPLGLIMNELITNIYKHAFKKGEKGKVTIGINKIKENHYKLVVKDNGKGFSKKFDITKINSLGLKLINILTKQLKGEVICKNDNGAKYIITFRDDVAV